MSNSIYSTPTIVICDIDGTLSKVGDRLKFLKQNPPDWDSFYEDCFEDEPIPAICDLVSEINRECLYLVIFITGRRESVREKTVRWLRNNLLSYYSVEREELLMRANDDYRHDIEVKPELALKAGLTPEKVAFILEDRDSMVEKWRELGYTCLQVAKGDF